MSRACAFEPAPPCLPSGKASTDHVCPPPAEPLDSQTLLQGSRWVEIHHKGAVYRLQLTRQDKLILTK